MNSIFNRFKGYNSINLKQHKQTLLSNENIDNLSIDMTLDENINYITQTQLTTSGISETLYGTYNIVEDDNCNVKKDCLKSFNERIQKLVGKNTKYTNL